MVAFIGIGVVGLVLMLASLLFSEVFEGLLDVLDVDSGGGLFSLPVIGAFLAAFGFGGALVMWGTEAGAVAGAAGGTASGLLFGYAALRMTRALMNMPTDANFRTSDLVGKSGVVITRIPDGGYGEVSVSHLGQRTKLNARAVGPIAAGTAIVVVEVTSPSSVKVEPEATFFGTIEQESSS